MRKSSDCFCPSVRPPQFNNELGVVEHPDGVPPGECKRADRQGRAVLAQKAIEAGVPHSAVCTGGQGHPPLRVVGEGEALLGQHNNPKDRTLRAIRHRASVHPDFQQYLLRGRRRVEVSDHGAQENGHIDSRPVLPNKASATFKECGPYLARMFRDRRTTRYVSSSCRAFRSSAYREYERPNRRFINFLGMGITYHFSPYSFTRSPSHSRFIYSFSHPGDFQASTHSVHFRHSSILISPPPLGTGVSLTTPNHLAISQLHISPPSIWIGASFSECTFLISPPTRAQGPPTLVAHHPVLTVQVPTGRSTEQHAGERLRACCFFGTNSAVLRLFIRDELHFDFDTGAPQDLSPFSQKIQAHVTRMVSPGRVPERALLLSWALAAERSVIIITDGPRFSRITVPTCLPPPCARPQHPSLSLPHHPPLSLPHHPPLSLPQHPSLSLPQHPSLSLPSLQQPSPSSQPNPSLQQPLQAAPTPQPSASQPGRIFKSADELARSGFLRLVTLARWLKDPSIVTSLKLVQVLRVATNRDLLARLAIASIHLIAPAHKSRLADVSRFAVAFKSRLSALVTLLPSATTSPPDPASKPAVEQATASLLALPNELLARRVANRKRRHVDKITARYTRADQLIGQGRISTAVSLLRKGEVQLTPDEQLAAMTAARKQPVHRRHRHLVQPGPTPEIFTPDSELTTLANSNDECGFDFFPYDIMKLARGAAFLTDFEITWDNQSYVSNAAQYPSLNYDLVKSSTGNQALRWGENARGRWQLPEKNDERVPSMAPPLRPVKALDSSLPSFMAPFSRM
ncbi:hypothetical protein PAPYR_5897 [Paratrimastix pyriformis]|uniref:Uncharacterized protein n=1 Tax=Paratrimastix pyriformis TaxID=342808 RepID=A0ABQ8UGG8_9EUKA|nr:hypothetical protein PAPYR_5897 [Paratrimastix pyriformis]